MEKFYDSLHQFDANDLRLLLYNLLNTVESNGKDSSTEEKSLQKDSLTYFKAR